MRHKIKILAVIFLVFIFIFDLFIPPGTAVAAFYFMPLSFVIHQSRKTIITFAMLCGIFTITDTIFGTLYPYQPFFEITTRQSILLERCLVFTGITLLTYISLRHNRMKKMRDEKKKVFLDSMEAMLFMTSHKVRQPITEIMAVSNLLKTTNLSQEEIVEIIGGMKDSVLQLDNFTRELTDYMDAIKKRETLYND